MRSDESFGADFKTERNSCGLHQKAGDSGDRVRRRNCRSFGQPVPNRAESCGADGRHGRSFDGSYAEYVLLPSHHVFAVSSDLPWEELAAVPETYFTAWGSLFEGLNLKPEDTLLVRGATCALGYAAIQIAKASVVR